MLTGKGVTAGFLRAVSMTIAPFARSRGKAGPRGCHRRVVHDPATDRRSRRCGTPHPPPYPPPLAGEGRVGVCSRITLKWAGAESRFLLPSSAAYSAVLSGVPFDHFG